MEDIVNVVKSMDNVTINQVCDIRAPHFTQNVNYPIPLNDNNIINDKIGDSDDFLIEMKLIKTKASSVIDSNDEENSLSLLEFVDLSQSDIQDLLIALNGIWADNVLYKTKYIENFSVLSRSNTLIYLHDTIE